MGIGSCMEGIMRIILIFLNVITLIAGGVLLGCSVYALVSFNPFVTDTEKDVNAYLLLLYVIIALGAFVVLISLMGCLGACLQSNGLLTTYFFLVLVLVLVEVGIGILVVVEKDDIEEKIDSTFQGLVKEYGSDDATDAYIDAMQNHLHCCGYNGPQDYIDIESIIKGLPDCAKNIKVLVEPGCKEKISEFIKDNTVMVIIGVSAVGVLEILTMLMACFIRKRQMRDAMDSPPYSF